MGDLSLLLVRLDPLGLRVCPEPGFSEGDLGGLGIPDPPQSPSPALRKGVQSSFASSLLRNEGR